MGKPGLTEFLSLASWNLLVNDFEKGTRLGRACRILNPLNLHIFSSQECLASDLVFLEKNLNMGLVSKTFNSTGMGLGIFFKFRTY